MRLDDAPFPGYQKETDAAEAVPLARLESFQLKASVAHDLPEFNDGFDLADSGDEFVVGPFVLSVLLKALKFKFLRIVFDVPEDFLPVHTVCGEGQGVGLHLLPREDFVGSAGARRDLPFSRAVEDHLSEYRLPSRNIFDYDPFDCIPLLDDIDRARVEQKVHV